MVPAARANDFSMALVMSRNCLAEAGTSLLAVFASLPITARVLMPLSGSKFPTFLSSTMAWRAGRHVPTLASRESAR